MRKNFLMMALVAVFATATTLVATGSADAADIKGWKRKVAMTVAKKQVYPRSALRREIEGSAKVKVTVDHSGKIASFEILQPTGHQVLDREIPRLMERIDPLPKPPADASDEQLTFIIPLAWVLQ